VFYLDSISFILGTKIQERVPIYSLNGELEIGFVIIVDNHSYAKKHFMSVFVHPPPLPGGAGGS
jgi:hypothetical protein